VSLKKGERGFNGGVSRQRLGTRQKRTGRKKGGWGSKQLGGEKIPCKKKFRRGPRAKNSFSGSVLEKSRKRNGERKAA